jgi:hypothetical protein
MDPINGTYERSESHHYAEGSRVTLTPNNLRVHTAGTLDEHYLAYARLNVLKYKFMVMGLDH